jgi:hypothetical protein
MARYATEHPGWTAVYAEFWTHASRRHELRRRVATQHERLLNYAISRGMGLETLLAGEPGPWTSSRRCLWPTR